jgi:hypothetical protein
MSLNLKLANRVHDWLIEEGKQCHSQEDVDRAVDRFLQRWPRDKSAVLQYVFEMLIAELHPRTFYPLRILKRVRERIANNVPAHRSRWWQIGSGYAHAQPWPC